MLSDVFIVGHVGQTITRIMHVQVLMQLHRMKKTSVAPEEEKAATSEKPTPPQCLNCKCNKTENVKLMSCPNCSTGTYCSESCMETHENHVTYCPWIVRLEKLETVKRMKNEIFAIDAEKLPYCIK